MLQNALSTRRVRVFVSSTFVDMIAARDAAKATIERLNGAEFVGMELFGARPASAETVSVEEVDGADLYVGIVGGRWGTGITEAEYRRARENNLDCLFYVMSEEAITVRDDEPEKRERLAAWKREITDSFTGYVVRNFAAPDDLSKSIPLDLHNWLYQRLVKDAQRSAAEGQLPLLRSLAQSVRDPRALKSALTEKGIAVGDDLLETLVALSPTTANLLVEGIDALPNSSATSIENFITSYLGTPGNPVPFGGRADFMQRLDGWLADDFAPPYLLIAEEAGRGKSAALVRWSRTVMSDERYAVVFVPVSIRYHTNLAGVFFAALAARLAHVHGKTLNTQLNTSADVWRGLASEYLKQPLSDGRTLVVVIDGLDEAADWTAGPDLFPFTPAERVRLVVSARFTSTTPTREAWREQLGWDTHLSTSLELHPLTEEGVRDVVVRMGFSLAELGERVDVVQQLHRLSEGDPLIVNLYVKELWKKGDAAARLTAAELAAIEPGLDGFFKKWWDDQHELWGDDAPLKEPGVTTILNLLSCASGPLTRDDLIALAPVESRIDTWSIEHYLEPIARFVIDDDGLVFNHPRFGQYIHGKLKREAARWERLFVAWGGREVARLTSGELSPLELSPYLIQYYSHHLQRSRAPANDFLALLIPEWRQAWEKQDGGLSGLLADVHRAWETVMAENDREMQAGREPVRIGDEIYCALCSASIRSITENIDAPLIERLVDEKIWNPQQALAYARNTTDNDRKVAALIAASKHLGEAQRRKVLEEVLVFASSNLVALRSWQLILLAAPEVPIEILKAPLEARPETETHDVVARLFLGGREDVLSLQSNCDAIFPAIIDARRFRQAFLLGDRLSPDNRLALLAIALWHGEPIPDSFFESFVSDVPVAKRLATLLTDRSQRIESEDELRTFITSLFGAHPETLLPLQELVNRAPRELATSLLSEVTTNVSAHLAPLMLGDEPAASAAAEAIINELTAQASALLPLLAPFLRGGSLQWLVEELATGQESLSHVAEIARKNGEVEIVWQVACTFAEQQRRLAPISDVYPHLDDAMKATATEQIIALFRTLTAPSVIALDLDDVAPASDPLETIAPLLSGKALIAFLEIASRVGDQNWRMFVADLLRIRADETFSAFAKKYKDGSVIENGDEMGFVALSGTDIRNLAVDVVITLIKEGTKELSTFRGIDGLTMTGSDPAEGARIRRRLWQWVTADPERIVESVEYMTTEIPSDLLAAVDRNAVLEHLGDKRSLALLPFIPTDKRHLILDNADTQVSIMPIPAEALSPAEADAFVEARLETLATRRIGLESLFERVSPRGLGLLREEIEQRSSEPLAMLALLPFLSGAERHEVIEMVFQRSDSHEYLGVYVLRVAIGFFFGSIPKRDEVLADLAAALSTERVTKLLEALEKGLDVFVIAGCAQAKAWSATELLELMRLVISPQKAVTRQILLMSIAAMRDALAHLGGRKLLDTAAANIERAAVMFP